jgi:hypothetical protein
MKTMPTMIVTGLFLSLMLTTACKDKNHETWSHGNYGTGSAKKTGDFGACVPEDLVNKSCK